MRNPRCLNCGDRLHDGGHCNNCRARVKLASLLYQEIEDLRAEIERLKARPISRIIRFITGDHAA